jgi:GTPase SAR1 family protein
VYDITDKDSFLKVTAWVKELKTYLTQDVPIIIAGNKCDLANRQIPLEEAESYFHFASSQLITITIHIIIDMQ